MKNCKLTEAFFDMLDIASHFPLKFRPSRPADMLQPNLYPLHIIKIALSVLHLNSTRSYLNDNQALIFNIVIVPLDPRNEVLLQLRVGSVIEGGRLCSTQITLELAVN
jgi:hypothetical protein